MKIVKVGMLMIVLLLLIQLASPHHFLCSFGDDVVP